MSGVDLPWSSQAAGECESPEDIYPSPQPPLSAVRTSGPRGGLAEGKGGGLGRLQGQSRLGLR